VTIKTKSVTVHVAPGSKYTLKVKAATSISGDRLAYIWRKTGTKSTAKKNVLTIKKNRMTVTNVRGVIRLTCWVNSTLRPAGGIGWEHVTVTVDAKNHTYGAWTTVREATVFRKGLKERTCTKCGYTARKKTAKADSTLTASQKKVRLTAGKTYRKLTVTMGNGDSIVSWKSSKPSVVTVTGKADGTCVLRAKKAGKACITVKTGSGASLKIPVVVKAAE